VTLAIDAPRGKLEHHFLDDGVQLYALEQPGDLAAANARERLQLLPQHAEAYARFALRHGLGLHLVERPDQLRWRPGAPTEQKEPAARAVRPLRMVISPEGGFEVTVFLELRRDLLQRRYKLAADGVLQLLEEKVVAANIPVIPPNF
jgi:hypothetical protein